jgi:threonine aldolase
MRQAGVLAAAGIIALETIVPRLGEDHHRARALAAGLAQIPGIELDPGTPQSNMVYLTLGNRIPYKAQEVAQKLSAHDILVGVVGERRFRLVTHYWIDAQAVEQTITAFSEVVQA